MKCDIVFGNLLSIPLTKQLEWNNLVEVIQRLYVFTMSMTFLHHYRIDEIFYLK
jgi:hypothetical protein